ncbi:MAG: hypothetical protein H0X25_11210 [Acidobacteriales bacterium]|nr:hypothetical protein [Terriglobales bacterium]
MPKATKPGKPHSKPIVNGGAVACWQDDPGDPKVQPSLSPIQVPIPNQAGTPYPFKIAGRAPVPQVYSPGTREFLYYAAACALRRTADLWGGIVPRGTRWQVGSTLPVNVDSGVDLNAFYTRGEDGNTPGLHFFHDAVRGRVFFSGESPDISSHEMGHAVLDSLKPQLFDAQSIEAAAFHESFGDMSAMLSALQVPSFRSELLGEVVGGLNRNSRLSRLAEQLGAAIRLQHPDAVDSDCLRNAANSFFYRDPQTLPPFAPASQLSSEPHSFSRVFTAGFLDALAGIFKLNDHTPDGLMQSSLDMAQLLVGGVLNSAVVPDYYSQVAANMLQVGEAAPFSGKYRDALRAAFVRRGILSLQASVTLAGLKRPAGKGVAMETAPASSAELPTAIISAGQFGLKSTALKVHIAAQPKRYAITGASLMLGPLEPRSAQNAAESYVEDLFQRGRVDVGSHAQPTFGTSRGLAFRTHVIQEDEGELLLKRVTFDCGFEHRED